MKMKEIKHVVKSDEVRRTTYSGVDDVTLATIHAIKGLEAEMVFVIGCTNMNFPCKGSEHPIIDMVKVEEYDKEAEEHRLFYVALSRAKSVLYLSYTGKNHTDYLDLNMLKIIDSQKKLAPVSSKVEFKMSELVATLKQWRIQDLENYM